MTERRDTHGENGLTGIPLRIHLASANGGDGHEQDAIEVDAFLDALTRIAASIAAREVQHHPTGNGEVT